MPTVTIGENTGDDFSGTEDTYGRENQGDNNFSTDTNFRIDHSSDNFERTGFIKFSGLSNISATATVSATTMHLYVNLTSISTGAATFHRLLRVWVEDEATWNSWKTSNSWTTGGAKGDGTDRDSTDSGTIVAASVAYQTLSDTQFTSDAQDFIDGTLVNNGYMGVRTDSIEDGEVFIFTSSEGTDGQRPYLSVTYTTGGASVNATLGTITIQGLDATVQANVDVSVNATLGTIVIDGLDATVTTGANVDVNATLGTIEISGLDATVQANVDTNVSATLGTIVLAGLGATVNASTKVNATLGTIEISGLDASVSASINVNATLGTLTITGLDATISRGNIAIDCGSASTTATIEIDCGFADSVYTYAVYDITAIEVETSSSSSEMEFTFQPDTEDIWSEVSKDADGQPYFWVRNNTSGNVIEFRPKPNFSGAEIRVTGYDEPTELDEFSDETRFICKTVDDAIARMVAAEYLESTDAVGAQQLRKAAELILDKFGEDIQETDG